MELGDRGPRHRGCCARGMTLIEVVVATAVVMIVVIAASNAIAAVHGATVRAGGREAAEASVASEREELRSLPFAAAGRTGRSPADVVSRVFPNADAGRGAPDAAFSAEPRAGCPAATFFTVRAVSGGSMTIAATFVVGTATGWTAVPAARLSDYDTRRAVELPSAALLVRVTVDWRAGQRSGVVARTVIVADRPAGPCRIAAPATPGAT